MSEKLVQKTSDMAVVQMDATPVSVRLAEPAIRERQDRNYASWSNSKNWKFGAYFGKNDSRLWVPKKGDSSSRTFQINFAHPLGRKSFATLVLAYAICATAGGIVIYAVIQQFR